MTHELVRRNSDWAVVCRSCGAEFWAAGSDVDGVCPASGRETSTKEHS